jgi:predicted RNA-binding Zn ribbon-like protein
VPAHYEIVANVRLPVRLAGHPALDFCNTRSGWNGGGSIEYLDTFDHLAIWTGFVGLLPPRGVASLRREAARRPRAASAALARALRFRAALYEVIHAQRSAVAWDLVAREVHAAASALELRRSAGAIRFEVATGSPFLTPLASVAWAAGELLASPDLPLVRACPGRDCGWLFLDRRGRRRWCTMGACGNRAKARRFAARHAARR